ncbi:MAG: EscU/YscU/HrcU family type III secretion system export apparatus switch protein [Spirochaetes bacterium]|nr:EscU/YscU/HrcU family type III secretion system export apparatus switch protein [Spirochaetota bacterium]
MAEITELNILYYDIEIPDDFYFDLQRFASAESEGRTEKATEHKKRKAREEGRVALSKEVPAALITLFCFILIYFMAGYFFDTLKNLFIYVFENIANLDLNDKKLIFDLVIFPFLKIFLPVSLMAYLIAGLSNYLQIGLKFTFKAIKPDFKKVSPNIFKFLKNHVFSVTAFFNLIKSIVKIAIIVTVSYMSIKGNLDEIKKIIFIENIFYSFTIICKIAFSIIFKSTIILLIFSIADILFVKWHFEQSLKMKKEEIKEEYKELYGDPNVKMRLRRMYQTFLSQKRMLEEVPKADVVITNPIHYAVALHYDKYTDEAPRVRAKGKDNFALKIKKAAIDNEVFVYENPPLARALYNEVEVNDIIPRPMYGLVVNAYKLAMEHNERKKVAV